MNQIVLVTYDSGMIRWYPFELGTLELISINIEYIVDVQIIDADNVNEYTITKYNQEPTIKKYLFTITLLDHSIEQTEAYCDCPITWVVDNYHHDDMLDWGWIQILGGEQ